MLFIRMKSAVLLLFFIFLSGMSFIRTSDSDDRVKREHGKVTGMMRNGVRSDCPSEPLYGCTNVELVGCDGAQLTGCTHVRLDGSTGVVIDGGSTLDIYRSSNVAITGTSGVRIYDSTDIRYG